MPARRLLMRKIRKILRLRHEQGLSHREIAQACAIGPGTVSRYLERAARRGLGWPLPPELDDTGLAARLFPRGAPVHDRARPDCAHIHRELRRDGVTLQPVAEQELLPPGNFSTVGTNHNTKRYIDSNAGPVRRAPCPPADDDAITGAPGGLCLPDPHHKM